MTTPAQDFAYRVSERVQYAELRVQRMLGADWIEAYGAAWRIMDEVYDLAVAPDRPAVNLPLRMIENRRFAYAERIIGDKIITSFDYPPIPDRRLDWSAVTDNYDGAEDSNCPIGRGATEQEAVHDLVEQIEENRP